MLKILDIPKYFSCFFMVLIAKSCNIQKKQNTDYTKMSPVLSDKISTIDLEKAQPTIIHYDGKDKTMYHVIIYTTLPELLKEKGILVQSVSKTFVTALIKKEDLEIIYTTKGVEKIALPGYEYPNKKLIP